MPQIETPMLIGLGFCLAAIIALVRAAWKLAVQLSQRRAQRSDVELRPAAELDEESLKAEYTKLRRRFELKVEDGKTQTAKHMAELLRARYQTEELKAAHAEACKQREARERTLRQELDAANSNADKLKADIATEHTRIAELVETATAYTQSLGENAIRIAELEVAAASHEGTSVAHLNEIAALTDELNQARQDSEELHTTVRQLSDDLTTRTCSLEEVKIDVQRVVQEKSASDERLSELTGTDNERLGTLNRLEQEVKQRDEDLAQANRELGELQSAKTAIEQDRDASRLMIEARDSAIKQLEIDITDANSDLEARDAIVVMLRKQIASQGAALAALNEEISGLRRRTGTEITPPRSADTCSDAQNVRAAKKKASYADTDAARATTASRLLASRIRSLQQIIIKP